jgi:hypothetical protein
MGAFSEVECMGKVVALIFKKIMEKKFKKVIVNVKQKMYGIPCVTVFGVSQFLVCGSIGCARVCNMVKCPV